MKNKVERHLKEYEDIIHLPHYVSLDRKQMPIKDRSAQFSPFAAVVGHEIAVKEAARYTDQKRELDETQKAVIDDQLRIIEAKLPELLEANISYFKPDPIKAGGEYLMVKGSVKKIDNYERLVLMTSGLAIQVEEIYGIEIC